MIKLVADVRKYMLRLVLPLFFSFSFQFCCKMEGISKPENNLDTRVQKTGGQESVVNCNIAGQA